MERDEGKYNIVNPIIWLRRQQQPQQQHSSHILHRYQLLIHIYSHIGQNGTSFLSKMVKY